MTTFQNGKGKNKMNQNDVNIQLNMSNFFETLNLLSFETFDPHTPILAIPRLA